ncbi:protein indeterminate-domain 5, chloroplastic-like [Canna indica]|uniref:Protein EARLY HEADING DATE 2 n=1 Tax=Canna indica TaxID=4628 RepID=A0AAQ3JR96_9LILI|nr:protein indeterminate-domain 5, chloroplastic-like [Canna indica]
MAAASSSSVPFFGSIREDDQYNKQQQLPPSSNQLPSATPAAPPKKKRNLPGNPNPDAEVIALSPKTLLATNRFICEVCNKGFQREQNLQLHRRGHNLPWKLKQKNPKEARRRVYLCPEPSCVHHDPSRALGDLTGIKKHYCRKHGEKKWKCDKCSKKYAVQSDWKAHSKTCGTREYRCDCGTLFSRRDSFITHRAFCDALAQESARIPSGGINSIGSHLYGNNSINMGLPPMNSQLASLQNLASSDLLRLGGGSGGAGAPQFGHLTTSSFRPPQSSPFYLAGGGGGSSQDFSGLIHDMQTNTNASSSSAAAAAGNLFNLGFFSNSRSASALTSIDNVGGNLLLPDQFNNASGNNDPTSTLFSGNAMSNNIAMTMSSLLASNESAAAPPQMSATALLQKAAQMGATSSGGAANCSSLLTSFGSSYSSAGGKHAAATFAGDVKRGGGESSRRQAEENENHFQSLMNSLANGSGGIFSGGGNELLCNVEEGKLQHVSVSLGGSDDRLTRDFLGVGGVVRAGMRQAAVERQMGMDGLESELKVAGSCSLPFGEGSSLESRKA